MELDNIIKKKEKYIEEHPEQRKLVYRSRRQPKDGRPSKGAVPASGPAEEEEGGLLIVLVDPTLTNCVYTEDTDDDIPMPEAPPPGVSKEEEEEDTDDDIPMPEGPPPGSARTLYI